MSERSDVKVKSLFREPEKYADKTIVLSGWARQNRASNHFGFIQLNDGSFQETSLSCGGLRWKNATD